MPISDLCSQELVSVEGGSSLQFAAQLMKKHHVGGVVVVESNGLSKPVGILTDRDIVMSIVAENKPFNVRVADVMTRNLVKVKKSDGIAEVAEQMAKSGVRRIIVTDEAGNACGLVSADDILQLVAKELDSLGRLVVRQGANEKMDRTYQTHLTI